MDVSQLIIVSCQQRAAGAEQYNTHISIYSILVYQYIGTKWESGISVIIQYMITTSYGFTVNWLTQQNN